MTMLKKLLLNFIPTKLLDQFKKTYYNYKFKMSSENNEIDMMVLKYLINDGSHVVDIGANYGLYTKLLSTLVGNKGSVYSIEPVPSTYQILSNNVKVNRITNVLLFNFAVSDKDGSGVMEIPCYASGRENYYRANLVGDNHNAFAGQHVEVKLRSLDSLLYDIKQEISFIKIDVEGHEYEVITGAANIIARDKPILLVEISESIDKVFSFLKSNAYNSYYYDGKKIKLRDSNKSINWFFLTDEQYKQYLNKSAVG